MFLSVVSIWELMKKMKATSDDDYLVVMVYDNQYLI
jgi:hypothetical protein